MRSGHVSYIARFALITLVCSLIITALSFGLSSYLFTDSFNRSDAQTLSRILQSGESLLLGYYGGFLSRSALWDEVNPLFNTGDSFLILLDASGRMLAYTDAAVPYMVRIDTSRIISRLMESSGDPVVSRYTEQGTVAYIACSHTGPGYVIAGKTRSSAIGFINSFRTRLLVWTLGILTLAAVLSAIGTRLAARPVRALINATERIVEGEKVHVEENMPGEIRDIARAFNIMSARISSAFQSLKTERDNMSLILESLSEGIIAMDSGGSILHMNSAALSLLGGKDTPLFGRVLSQLRSVLPDGGQGSAGKFPSGEKELLCVISPITDSSGKRGAAALIRDVTEEERLERTRHDYVANISHELRTPLASIKGIAEGIRDGMVTEKEDMDRCIGIIVDESTRLSRLVNDLLELSGLQSNPSAFEMERVSPTELVLDLHDRNRSLFEKAGLNYLFDLPRDRDGEVAELPEVTSNEDRLAEVLTIFLDNARKYTPRGGTVTLGASCEKDGIRFFVSDTGIGMDDETRRLAFDRFHQAEKSHSDKGSGLGLAIAREIMQKMNVSISLESSPGKGSTFSFVIPLPRADALPGPSGKEAPPDGSAEKP